MSNERVPRAVRRSRFTPEIVSEMRHLHDDRGWSWARVGRRYGTSNVHARRVVLSWGLVNEDCPAPHCVCFDPHSHCDGCGLIIRSGRICSFCVLEAQRAVLMALGEYQLSDHMRMQANPDVIVRVLAFQAERRLMFGSEVTTGVVEDPRA